MNDCEQRLLYIEVLANHWSWKNLNDQGLQLEDGWRIASFQVAGPGQSDYRSTSVVVLLERPRRKPKETEGQQ